MNEKILNNFFIIQRIVEEFDSDEESILNFLQICKSTWKFMGNVRYSYFPIHKLQRLNSNSKLAIPVDVKVLVRNIPLKYHQLEIDSQEILDSLDTIIERFDIISMALLFELKSLPRHYPKSLERLLIASSRFNEPILKNQLPDTLLHLWLPYSFEQPLQWLPSHLESLSLLSDSVNPIISGNLSLVPSLKKLCCNGKILDLLTVGSIPSTVEYLVFYGDRKTKGKNPIAANVIPEGVMYLHLPKGNVNLQPGSIPSTVRFLKFNSFNRSLLSSDGVSLLPRDLEILKMGSKYDTPLVKGVFSPCTNLHTLKLYCYNQLLQPGVLPESLKVLYLGENFERELQPGSLPQGLEKLVFSDCWNFPISPGTLPVELRELYFGENFNQELSIGVLPQNLEILELGGQFNHPLVQGCLPESLRQLDLSDQFAQDIKVGDLPTQLESLSFGSAFDNHIEPGSIPRSIQILSFPNGFDCRLESGSIPDTVQEISFGIRFNQPLDPGVLPQSLQILRFGDHFNQPLPLHSIPNNIVDLTFGEYFNQILEPLPNSLCHLTLSKSFKSQNLKPNSIPPHTIVTYQSSNSSLFIPFNCLSN
ncbi:hypothetical protein DLAC_00826 [Tieghemostelium lacteum]|uniref:FNIP repeat-containing protein n=1 Tax=Tieghemostelium lacteum TaxID=361077 RepID=A0A152A728_TIELA|nr:hypothetical protein DLAC_00826 [Tieghemostelium lacteum]|eukprot:KYR02030.1 hypothetical protein DLAC_00826 [Tieghemostelium lacteum]